MTGTARAMSQRRSAVHWVAWLGALAVAATVLMGVGHATHSASSHGESASIAVLHSDHGADAAVTAAAGSPPAVGHADLTCATCGPHDQGAAFACMLLIIVAALAATALRAPLTWVMRRITLARTTEPRPIVVAAAPNLTSLGISRT